MILDSSILIAEERGRFALQDLFADRSGELFFVPLRLPSFGTV
jgi:hypothetical protein